MLIGILLITVFFILPRNQQWIIRLIGYAENFRYQLSNLETEKRMQRRFGNDYNYSKIIFDSVAAKANKSTALVLIPPPAYFKKSGIDYNVPEPAVFYYFTGLKTTGLNSPMADQANWYVRLNGQQITIDTIKSIQSVRDSILLFINKDVSQ